MGNQPECDRSSDGDIERSLRRLRNLQANRVMPLIGPLLDAFEQIPNDILGMDELSGLCVAIEAINSAMESDDDG